MNSLICLFSFFAISSALVMPMNLVLQPNAAGQNWAVLVAGSNTWGNYRHQADVCHSYQVLVKHGFNKDNIIVMMFDDIASDTQNPTQGQIINWPNGKNVYTGVSKDYTKADVTPANFLKVLKGEKVTLESGAAGKVLNSGPNDNVFVFFSDHGGPGIIAFPSQLLQATDLNDALKYMNLNKKYNQLVFYLEACESGSMFDQLLPKNINIYATTASDPVTSSYACYYDAKRNTYLGDLYSVLWMEDSDTVDITKETLDQQFKLVKKECNQSTVCFYGDDSWKTEPVSFFQSGQHAPVAAPKSIIPRPNPNLDAVDSRDVALEILKKDPVANAVKINALLQQRQDMAALYRIVVAKVAGEDQVGLHMSRRVVPTQMFCLRDATQAFNDFCFSYSKFDWGMKLASSFVSMCEAGFSSNTIVDSIKTACPDGHKF